MEPFMTRYPYMVRPLQLLVELSHIETLNCADVPRKSRSHSRKEFAQSGFHGIPLPLQDAAQLSRLELQHVLQLECVLSSIAHVYAASTILQRN